MHVTSGINPMIVRDKRDLRVMEIKEVVKNGQKIYFLINCIGMYSQNILRYNFFLTKILFI